MMIGQTVSHYKILEKLGEGGMGIVYKAEDTRLKRTVALKFLSKESTRDQEARERFEREAQAAASLNHPNIVTVYEINEHEDQTYIAMEYVEEETPAETARLKEMPIEKTIDFIIQVCEGLEEAHGAGIIHRDIKLQNLILDKSGRAKILDFGLAKLKGASKITKEIFRVGTVHYMSPEQAIGEEVDHRTDIWSLGVVLYELVTGQMPFKGEHEQAVVYSILNENPGPVTDLRTDVPMELERIVNRTLEKDPSKRYQHAYDLILDLKKLQKGSKPGITSFPRFVPVHSFKKSYQKFLLPGIFLLIVFIAVTSLWLFRGPSKPAPLQAALNPKRVAVAVFENLTGDESLDVLGRMAADWTTQGISRIDLIEVVPTRAVMELLPVKKNGKEDLQGMSYIKSLAEEVNAGTVISGSYYLSGDNLYFQANITDIEHGKLILSPGPVIGSKKSPTHVIDRLKQKILGALISYFDPGYPLPSGLKIPSFEAYKEFMTGSELFGSDYPRAIAHYKRAVELDPDFQLPKLYIAGACINQNKYARADAILQQLYEKRSQLTDFERYYLEWCRALLKGDRERVLHWIRKAGEIAPRSRATQYIIGAEALKANRPQETIDTYEQFDEKFWRLLLGMNSWRILYQARAYHMVGNYQREFELAKKGQELFPEQLLFFSIEVRALAAFGKIEELKNVIDKSLILSFSTGTITSAIIGTPGDVMREAALELRAHGHMNAYREIVKRAVTWYKNRPPQEASTENHRYSLACILYLAEQWDQSQRIFKDLAEKKPDNIHYKGYLGVLAVRTGNPKEARRISEELRNISRPYLFGVHTYWCARIASLMSEKQRAVELLGESFTRGLDYGIYLHRDMDFEPIKDYPPFKRLIQPK